MVKVRTSLVGTEVITEEFKGRVYTRMVPYDDYRTGLPQPSSYKSSIVIQEWTRTATRPATEGEIAQGMSDEEWEENWEMII